MAEMHYNFQDEYWLHLANVITMEMKPRCSNVLCRKINITTIGCFILNEWLSQKVTLCFSTAGMEFQPCTVDVYRVSERMDYPRDKNGNITAMVHPNLQV